MRLVDPSLCASRRTMVELKQLADRGVVTVIEPTTYLGTPRRHAQTFLDDFERLIAAEPQRCRTVGLEHLSLLGVPAGDAACLPAAREAIAQLGTSLRRPGVVGIGEVGLETFSDGEVEVLYRQLRLARELRVPIVIQAPVRRKRDALRIALRLAREERLEARMVLVKGLDEDTLHVARRLGVWAGLTVHPAYLSPQRAIELVALHGPEGLMLQSDAGRGFGNPFAVPEVVERLHAAGVAPEAIARLTHHNPKAFFNQGIAEREAGARAFIVADAG